MVEAGAGLGIVPEVSARRYRRSMSIDLVRLRDPWQTVAWPAPPAIDGSRRQATVNSALLMRLASSMRRNRASKSRTTHLVCLEAILQLGDLELPAGAAERGL